MLSFAFVVFCKQKTAYEIRISDWISDVCSSDLLPHISGLELIEALKKYSTLASVPIMAVTAYAGKGDEDRIRAAGAEAYVSKPISVMKFIETVEELFRGRVPA